MEGRKEKRQEGVLCSIHIYMYILDNEWFSGAWVPSQADQSIAYKELFPVVVASHVQVYGALSGLGDMFFFVQTGLKVYFWHGSTCKTRCKFLGALPKYFRRRVKILGVQLQILGSAPTPKEYLRSKKSNSGFMLQYDWTQLKQILMNYDISQQS